MSDSTPHTHAFRVADLPQNHPARFALTPDKAEMERVAAALELLELRKLRFEGEISAQGRRDFALSGQLGATVVQACVVSLQPVTTRIDVPVQRRYLAGYQDPEGDEVEMPEDDTAEALGTHIDPAAVMVEALSLALPLYPRAGDAALEQSIFTEPGVAPMTDEAARPFAGLAALKKKLEGPDD